MTKAGKNFRMHNDVLVVFIKFLKICYIKLEIHDAE